MLALIFKTLVSTFGCLCGLLILRQRNLTALPEQRFLQLILGLQLIPAIGFFIVVYVILHQDVTSDVPAYYVPAARSVLDGKIPFLDFTSSYAPLFPYIGAALLSVWNSGKSFALFAMLLNVPTLLLWHSVAKAHFDVRTARETSVLFAASGHVMVQALTGSNQAWLAVAIAGSALLSLRGRDFAAGFVQSLALCSVKFLALLFWPVQWMLAPAKSRWVAGAVVLAALVYGGLAVRGADLLYPLRREAELTSSANLPYFLELFTGSGPSGNRLFDALT